MCACICLNDTRWTFGEHVANIFHVVCDYEIQGIYIVNQFMKGRHYMLTVAHGEEEALCSFCLPLTRFTITKPKEPSKTSWIAALNPEYNIWDLTGDVIDTIIKSA